VFQMSKWAMWAILNIYVSIVFQWYKELFKVMGFDPCNRTLKIREAIGTPTPNMGVHLGVWGFIPSHFALPGTCDVTPKSFTSPVTFNPLALVASLGLRLQHLNYHHCLVFNKLTSLPFLLLKASYLHCSTFLI
jgi:hypothetical protein